MGFGRSGTAEGGRFAKPLQRPCQGLGERASALAPDQREKVATLAAFMVTPKATLFPGGSQRERTAATPSPFAAPAVRGVAKQCLGQRLGTIR